MNIIRLMKIGLVGGLLLSSALNAYRGRLIPMALNRATDEWNVLLGHDIGGYWTDFSQEARQGERGNVVAQQALTHQTNNQYNAHNVTIAGAPWERTMTGDIVHFVKVPYIAGVELYRHGRNNIKDDFAWIPVREFIGSRGDIARPHHGRPVNVSRGVKAMLTHYLPGAIGRLSNGGAVAGGGAAVGGGGGGQWNGAGSLYFYHAGQPYYDFTNFAVGYPIQLDGFRWPTTEHYFQAQKFPGNSALQDQIRLAPTAREAFNIARTHGAQVRPDWRTINIEAMLRAVRAKFNQHAQLRMLLMGTGARVLVEDAGANDDFWGAGAQPARSGQNHLGQVLMHIRAELRDGTTYPLPYRR